MSDSPSRRTIPGYKDESGSYVKKPDSEPTVDHLLRDGLTACRNIMDVILLDTKHGTPDRETVQNLKDVMAILQEVKKRQLELLDDASVDDLEAEQARRSEK